MRKIFSLLTAILFAGSMMATDYQLVNSTADLVAGAKYVIGSADATSAVFMGTKANNNNRVQTPAVDIANNKIVYQDTILKLELGGSEGHWTFTTLNYHGTDGYLSNANSGTTNALYVQADAREFTISFDGNKAVITSTGGNERKIMRYNSGSKCFACYGSGQKDIYLYKEVAGGGETPEPQTKDIQVVPGAWADYKLAAWAWEGSAEGAWYPVAEKNEQMIAEVPAAADHIIIVAFETTVEEFDWNAKVAQTSNQDIDACGVIYINNGNPTWCQPAEIVAEVYTVAGSSLLLGSNWATADEANDMTYNSETGIYTLVKENLELAAGNYDYKVVKDHDWGDGEYPTSGNNTLNIAEDGFYTVTFSFNPAAEENKLTAIAEKTGEAEIEHVYTVVGVEALTGYNWGDGLNAPENEMTKTADDLYTLVKENITLVASSYEYQVADNHDWRNVPNSVLEISQSGIYNVTFTFVPSTGATNAEAALQEAIDVDPTAVLGIGVWGGDEQDWSQADMVLSGDKSYATITKTLTAGDYRFKTVINGGWRSNAFVYHRGFPAAAGISGNENFNMKLQADVDGDYIFNWFFANDSLEIIFPAAVAPTAAPAEPTPERYQVKAVYAAKYEADCNFGEWSSGTQYAQEDYGKKFITSASGYFGLEFTGKNCSEMEYLHLDVWAASDIAFRVVPIHHGTEVGVTVNIEGQKWNAIDIALSEFAGVTDWSDVYQIKIDNAANLTFWLNNVYFYTTQTKTVDLVDGYYLIGTMNDWDIHNITAAHKFNTIPDNDVEYKLTYTLADGDNFKVVAVANNELGAWYPAEAGNYVVDFAHAGERDIYFRPDYQGGADWHASCIYVAPDADASPWETWFAIGDTWNPETQSYLDWDAENHKATVHINVSKYGQWRAQVKYHGPIAEEGKCYHVALKLKANHALNGVTIKWQDTPNEHPIVIEDQSVNLAANTEYVFDATGKAQAVNVEGGNGIMVLDFGWALEGDIIEIYDVVIEEVECPVLEPTYYLAGSMNTWNPNGDEQYLFTVNPDNEDELMLNCTLAEGDIFKVVETTSNSWFPTEGGEASNYVVDAAHAGDVTIYFRPDYQGGEGWHYGCIYVDVHTGTAISNTAVDAKAEKIMRNGMILIIKGDKTYNVMGQIVK